MIQKLIFDAVIDNNQLIKNNFLMLQRIKGQGEAFTACDRLVGS